MSRNATKKTGLALGALVALALAQFSVAAPVNQGHATQAHARKMSFFVTSVGLGKGADLGGLAGADQHCQSLAESVGAGKRTWHAYLSTTVVGGGKHVDARDRIGRGPWFNAKGVRIAANVDALHRDNNLNKETALTENGDVVNGRGDKPNTHDILTGSDSFGVAFTGDQDTTCGNWTKSGEGSAQVGHHDRMGLNDKAAAKSWVHAHPSRACSQEALVKTGGSGLFYCFAVK